MGKFYDYIFKKHANRRIFKTDELYYGIVARSKIEEELDNYGEFQTIRLYRPYKFVIMQKASQEDEDNYLIRNFGEICDESSSTAIPDYNKIPLEFLYGDYYTVPSLNGSTIPNLSSRYPLNDTETSPAFVDAICSRVMPLSSINSANIHISPLLSLNEINDFEDLINTSYDLDDFMEQ